MASKRGPGRPPKPPEDTSSAIAQLGTLIRRLRAQRGLTLMKLGELTGYSWQHLGAVERGQVVPSEDVVAACERTLAAGGQLLAAYPGVIREQASQRHRREAARHRGGPPPDPDVDWARLSAMVRRPTVVSRSIVEELEEITDRQRMLYHELSSAEMLVSVEAHLGLLVTLLEPAPAGLLRHAIASAAVEAAGFAAWLWFDLGDQYKMNTLYEMAADLAAESGNPALGAYVTGYRAVADDCLGLRLDAARHAEAAVVQAPAVTSRVTRSWLCAIGANTAVLVGDQGGARSLLRQACDHLEGGVGKEEWMYDFDQSALAGYRGTCLLRLRQATEAISAFESGLAALTPVCDRRGAQLRIGLAEAWLSSGHADRAMAMAGTALEVFAERGSAAGLRRVQRFRGLLAEAGHPAKAQELDERVHAYVGRTR